MLVLILGACQLVYGACDRMVKRHKLNIIGSKEKVLQGTAGSDETDRGRLFVVTPRLSPANHFVSHIFLTSPPVNDTGKYYRNTLLPVIDADSTHTSDELIQCSLASDPTPTCFSGQGYLVGTSGLSACIQINPNKPQQRRKHFGVHIDRTKQRLL